VQQNMEDALKKTGGGYQDESLILMIVDSAVEQREIDALRKYLPDLENSSVWVEKDINRAVTQRASGVNLLLDGKYSEAEEKLNTALKTFEDFDTLWQKGRTYYELGQLEAVQEHNTAAKDFYQQAIACYEKLGAMPDIKKTKEALKQL
jgi:tetratricopeptide (TPR) repeat protein